MTTVSRGSLLRWLGWFGIVNAGLFLLIGSRYLFAFGAPSSLLGGLYIGLVFVSQFAILAFIPLMALLGPIALLLPRKSLIMSLAVLFAALAVTLLVLDTNIFVQYRYHLSLLTAEIFEVSTWVFGGTIFLVMLGFQAMLAGNVWQRIAAANGRSGIWLALSLVVFWLGGQGIHIWADATAYSPVTSFTRYMPVYFPIKAKRRLAELGWVDPEYVAQQRLLRRAVASNRDGQLRYPINPLQCEAVDNAPNILFVLVDALRPDHVKAEFTPNITNFAARSQNFTNHFSGGNSSRMGIFSMFYGLPSTYWQTFYDLQKPPLLINQLQGYGYEIQGFSAVGFGSPAQINRTLFAAIEPADLYAGTATQNRNSEITGAWKEWLLSRESSQPYFSLLYYDPAQSDVPEPSEAESLPDVERSYGDYLRGIAAIDTDVADLLATLEVSPDERETLVIIASDHGYEFDELGLGNVGHGSNFGEWQLRSVLLMDWPERKPQAYSHRSAHQDLPGTLLRELFACSNDYADYTSGGNLFDEQSWQWIMAGSYSAHAIIEPDKIVVTYPGGLIELLDSTYRPASGLVLDAQLIEDAMLEMRRFYK